MQIGFVDMLMSIHAQSTSERLFPDDIEFHRCTDNTIEFQQILSDLFYYHFFVFSKSSFLLSGRHLASFPLIQFCALEISHHNRRSPNFSSIFRNVQKSGDCSGRDGFSFSLCKSLTVSKIYLSSQPSNAFTAHRPGPWFAWSEGNRFLQT